MPTKESTALLHKQDKKDIKQGTFHHTQHADKKGVATTYIGKGCGFYVAPRGGGGVINNTIPDLQTHLLFVSRTEVVEFSLSLE